MSNPFSSRYKRNCRTDVIKPFEGRVIQDTYRLIFCRHSIVSERLDKEEYNRGAKDGETAGDPERASSSLDRAGTTEICAVFELKY